MEPRPGHADGGGDLGDHLGAGKGGHWRVFGCLRAGFWFGVLSLR